MKVGSLVVVLPLPKTYPFWMNIKWLPVDDENTVYTIREICDVDGPAVKFEEGVIGHNVFSNGELYLDICFVKEVQPPGEVSIEALMEEVNAKELFEV